MQYIYYFVIKGDYRSDFPQTWTAREANRGSFQLIPTTANEKTVTHKNRHGYDGRKKILTVNPIHTIVKRQHEDKNGEKKLWISEGKFKHPFPRKFSNRKSISYRRRFQPIATTEVKMAEKPQKANLLASYQGVVGMFNINSSIFFWYKPSLPEDIIIELLNIRPNTGSLMLPIKPTKLHSRKIGKDHITKPPQPNNIIT